MPINKYLEQVKQKYAHESSREHAYRGLFENLLKEMAPKDFLIINEPSRITDCGNPDFLITKKDIQIGFIEAKDIGKDLTSKNYKEQFDRYKKSQPNLIITDYIWFRLFSNGELVTEVRIAELKDNSIISLPENFEVFKNLLNHFFSFVGQTIKSPKDLAKKMADKARFLENILENALLYDIKNEEITQLRSLFETLKRVLISDISPKQFADIYAQTLAYGMFSARFNDTTLESFSRQEAAELIPKTNPFLRKLFQHIAGYDIDERIKVPVDSLAEMFIYADVKEILKNFGRATQQKDPVIHFYETFLAEYDPKLRKSRGVWYTPEPVVNFIVRSVDEILKSDFNLPEGLADSSKITLELESQIEDKRKKGQYIKVKKEFHKVQILDPATGTGTFLSEVIKHIFNNNFQNMKGMWPGYVEDELIPRLNGFELLMASYTMAHLKLSMLLNETGYQSQKEQRFKVFLTNSLEEHHPDTDKLFSLWLSEEANEANYIKKNAPVMVVLGNPPYAVSSSNASIDADGKKTWIGGLVDDYKKNLNEKKINLDDDYIKFIRFGEYFIEKNKEGILAYISNNSFIDGITHRQMRKHLLETFDKIYILDLHGSAKKRETCPDGSPDENVFDIQQGVSINIFVKNKTKKTDTLAKVYHYDLFGKREAKYTYLWENNLKNIKWKELNYKEPNYFFVPKDFNHEYIYNSYFHIEKLFYNYSSGIETAKDKVVIQLTRNKITEIEKDFSELDEKDLLIKYDISNSKINEIKQDLKLKDHLTTILLYRPFDTRYTMYSKRSQGILWRPRHNTMSHLLNKDNLALLLCKRQTSFDFQHIFLSNLISERCCISLQTGEVGYIFPLYLYPEESKQETIIQDTERKPNLNLEIVNQIAEKISLTFTNEKEEKEGTFAPVDILDYIYAVLHSPTYREKYKEFLKIDFPRVPYPKDQKIFLQMVRLGAELREIHLLEKINTAKYSIGYNIPGDNKITRKLDKNDFEITDTEKELGKVWINDKQYFENVPKVAWEFYIGGYQPAQKWLKDRRVSNGFEKLEMSDIQHYVKIVSALCETDRIMKEIDKINFE